MKPFQIIVLISVIALSSCSKWGKDNEENNPYQGMTADQLYNDAQKALNKKEYASAAKRFEALETMYPFSDYTEDSQLELIYAYYESEDYPSAAATAERFIHLYPRAKHVDYAYYMKGLANFQQTRGVFAKLLPMDESWRDPGSETQAYMDFSIFIQKFPNSPYKPNALQRMIYLRNMFAQHELNVAQYYFKRRMYVAAIERASFCIKTYPQAPSNKRALVVIYKANAALGLKEAAAEALTVYQTTYPNSRLPEIN